MKLLRHAAARCAGLVLACASLGLAAQTPSPTAVQAPSPAATQAPNPAAALPPGSALTRPTPAAPTYQFRASVGGMPLSLGAQVLTPEERDFIDHLPEIRVGVPRPGFRPFESVSDGGEISGIHPEMLVYLARVFGLKLRPVVFADWAATLEAGKKREVDLLMSMGVTAERAEFFEFTLGTTPTASALGVRPVPAAPS